MVVKRIKCILTIVVLGVPLCQVFPQLNFPDLLTGDEITWLKSNKENIRFAPNPSWPPGDFIDDDSIHKGIIADYIKIFENKLGVSFHEIRLPSWDRIMDGLQDRTLDFVGAIQSTEDREKYLAFTPPFFSVPVVVIVRQDEVQNMTFSLSEMNELTLACPGAYTSFEYVHKNFPGAKLINCRDDLSALLQTSLGNTDGTIIDIMSASYLVEKYGINNLSLWKQLDYTWQLSFACRKDLPEFASILDKLLASVSIQEREEIYNKWVNIHSVSTPDFFEKNRRLILE